MLMPAVAVSTRAAGRGGAGLLRTRIDSRFTLLTSPALLVRLACGDLKLLPARYPGPLYALPRWVYGLVGEKRIWLEVVWR
jgi:hypothetical protein